MNWELLVAALDSLAWPPLTVVVLAIVLRREIRKLLGRLTRIGYREFQAEFDKELQEVALEAGVGSEVPGEAVLHAETDA